MYGTIIVIIIMIRVSVKLNVFCIFKILFHLFCALIIFFTKIP